MKKYVLLVLLVVFSTAVLAVSNPVTVGGKTYYKVTSTDPTEDTGNEVCTKLGKVCVGYTDTTSNVCKQFNPRATVSSSLSGDKSGVYCDGSPQGGVCSTKKQTCHTCPACTVSVQCNQPIGGLYREMYVECANPSQGNTCSVSLSAKNTQGFFNEIPSLNAQLQGCPQPVPKGGGLLLSKGDTVVHVTMNSGATQSFTVTVSNAGIVGIKTGSVPVCRATLTITENDLNTALGSSSKSGAAAFLFKSGKVGINGCTFLSRIKFFFVRPIAKFFIKAPALPPPAPAPNCGQVGEQCNNRGCFSGICGAPQGNTNGNYQCLALSEWSGKCEGRGNSPAPWHCITGPCS